MAQYVSQGNIFGRIGTGIGQGLAEQVPKEIENYRLRTGLQALADEADKGNLSPTQYLARAAGTYGATPQIVQSFGELAKQQARGKALIQDQNQQANQPAQSPFPQQQTQPQASPEIKETPTLTKSSTLKDILEGFRPKSQDERFQEAGRIYNENPAKFSNNPQQAIDYVNQAEDLRERQYNAALKEREITSGVEKNLIDSLRNHSENLEAKVPANVYTKIEDKAVNAIKPKSEGGEGLTEQQAKKKYGEELDEISRDYNSVYSIGDFGLVTQKPQKILMNLKSLQKKFKERGDTENFADTLIGNNGLSPQMAYSIAEPVSQNPKVNSILKKLPDISTGKFPIAGVLGELAGVGIKYPRAKDSDSKTLEISRELAPLLVEEKASPLAIAHELEKKGYNPDVWLDFVTNNEDLDLKKSQTRQLDKPSSMFDKLNDWWLSSFSGVK